MGNILITRPMPQALQTAKNITELGHAFIISPLTEFHDISHEDWPQTNQIDAIILTSARATNALPDPKTLRWQNVPLFAVGKTTADAAKAKGFSNLVYPIAREHSDNPAGVAGIVKALENYRHYKNILYITGKHQSVDLSARLATQGKNTTKIETYEMKALSLSAEAIAALENQDIDAVLHFSRRAAALFAAQAKNFMPTTHLCLSPDIATELAPHLTQADAAPPTISALPTHASMIELVAKRIK